MRHQVLVIHGGDTFATKEEYLEFLNTVPIDIERLKIAGWKESLRGDLGDGYEVLLPQMPNKTDARYEEWEIVFEKILPLLDQEVILVGHSMGGTFIAKYLAENKIDRRITAAFLIAAPFGNNPPEYSLETFSPPDDLRGFANQTGKIYILQSSDDPLVPADDAIAYHKALPNSELVEFTDRGHFSQSHLPELVEKIKKISE